MVLQDNSPEKWDISDHTKIKHTILDKYLSGWMRILGNSAYEAIHYVDGFAGKGTYNDGSKGSPLIAIDTFKRVNPRAKVKFFFIEKNKDNYSDLCSALSAVKYESETIKIYNKEFVDAWKDHLSQENLTPSLIFLDPFGFSGIPMEINKEIMSRKSVELLIVLMVRDLNRFINSPYHEETINKLFETQKWKKCTENETPKDRIDCLKNLYVEQLKKYVGAKYIWPFEMRMDDSRKTLYYIIHVTNSFKGLKLMKDITYKVGIEGRYAYLGPDQSQLRLDEIKTIDDLKEKLLEEFSGKRLSFEEIMKKTYLRYTRFIEKDYRDAIKQLANENLVEITRISSKKTGLKEKDLVYFRKPYF